MLPNQLRPLFTKLSKLYDECHDGEIEPDKARVCASIAGAMVKVLQSGQLEERVQAIERAANAALAERSA